MHLHLVVNLRLISQKSIVSLARGPAACAVRPSQMMQLLSNILNWRTQTYRRCILLTLSTLLKRGVLGNLEHQQCPFCNKVPSSSKFVGHVSHHLEELSLSAIPQEANSDSESDNTGSSLAASRSLKSIPGKSDASTSEPDRLREHYVIDAVKCKSCTLWQQVDFIDPPDFSDLHNCIGCGHALDVDAHRAEHRQKKKSKQLLCSQQQTPTSINPKLNDPYAVAGDYVTLPSVTNALGSSATHSLHDCPDNLCDVKPNTFRSGLELRHHIERYHPFLPFRTVWICIDKSGEGKMFSGCKQCTAGKKYGAYYNAVAHLRRTHFKPNPKERQSRDGISGRPLPPMDTLMNWVEERVEPLTDHPIASYLQRRSKKFQPGPQRSPQTPQDEPGHKHLTTEQNIPAGESLSLSGRPFYVQKLWNDIMARVQLGLGQPSPTGWQQTVTTEHRTDFVFQLYVYPINDSSRNIQCS